MGNKDGNEARVEVTSPAQERLESPPETTTSDRTAMLLRCFNRIRSPIDHALSNRASPLTNFLGTGLGLLFPQRCPLCLEGRSDLRNESGSSIGKSVKDATDLGLFPEFCSTCVQILRSHERDLCGKCGAPTARSAFLPDECAQCRGKKFAFERAIPLGVYRGRLRDVVILTKEPHAASLAAAVGRAMAMQAKSIMGPDLPDWIACSPMHWRRRWNRRVNNAERLAIAFGRESNLPFMGRLVSCTRETSKQSLLSVHQRRENVRGAFRVSKTENLEGRHVGLVDDTMTTGATADEISRQLLRAGASRVTLFLAARGVSD